MINFRTVEIADIPQIVDIYNSNSKFLINHLGVKQVDDKFILNELDKMSEFNFSSYVILDSNNSIIGVIDYKIEYDEIYLSLIMIHSRLQNKGLGALTYNVFERKIRKLINLNYNTLSKNSVMRVDVINDYTPNLVKYWSSRGFHWCEEIELEWGEKKSIAVVMKKSLKLNDRKKVRLKA
ncbi:hypothetical protein AN639_01530 [Candidatus Epulonipiscium fishelsonii]|uniref:Uncharacterized protein n=1 Tax=Candidatus Epulonipiscium fishelsonii TaxID=77094 RepID=A0ACC8XB93_9FIRM|nr:hypothetical protein AN639_01530 [Epulopiscium sp. SCG-B05WGA-EpuloA1]ONI39716.1 hypothetical protein AN396_07550 [Epulopiscium sp. SCG-B11WGA-EpuloA1]